MPVTVYGFYHARTQICMYRGQTKLIKLTKKKKEFVDFICNTKVLRKSN